MAKNYHKYSSYAEPKYNLTYQSGPRSESLSGTMCYNGELWLKKPGSRVGEVGLISLLSRLAMALSIEKWSPDCYFAFVDSVNACRGLPARCGFLHGEPHSISWTIPEEGKSFDFWTVWMEKQDINHLLDVLPSILARQLRDTSERWNNHSAQLENSTKVLKVC